MEPEAMDCGLARSCFTSGAMFAWRSVGVLRRVKKGACSGSIASNFKMPGKRTSLLEVASGFAASFPMFQCRDLVCRDVRLADEN